MTFHGNQTFYSYPTNFEGAAESAEIGFIEPKLFSLRTPRLRGDSSVAVPALQIIFDKSLGGGLERITTGGQNSQSVGKRSVHRFGLLRPPS